MKILRLLAVLLPLGLLGATVSNTQFCGPTGCNPGGGTWPPAGTPADLLDGDQVGGGASTAGAGDPGVNTACGSVGQMYVNTTTCQQFRCTDADPTPNAWTQAGIASDCAGVALDAAINGKNERDEVTPQWTAHLNRADYASNSAFLDAFYTAANTGMRCNIAAGSTLAIKVDGTVNVSWSDFQDFGDVRAFMAVFNSAAFSGNRPVVTTTSCPIANLGRFVLDFSDLQLNITCSGQTEPFAALMIGSGYMSGHNGLGQEGGIQGLEVLGWPHIRFMDACQTAGWVDSNRPNAMNDDANYRSPTTGLGVWLNSNPRTSTPDAHFYCEGPDEDNICVYIQGSFGSRLGAVQSDNVQALAIDGADNLLTFNGTGYSTGGSNPSSIGIRIGNPKHSLPVDDTCARGGGDCAERYDPPGGLIIQGIIVESYSQYGLVMFDGGVQDATIYTEGTYNRCSISLGAGICVNDDFSICTVDADCPGGNANDCQSPTTNGSVNGKFHLNSNGGPLCIGPGARDPYGSSWDQDAGIAIDGFIGSTPNNNTVVATDANSGSDVPGVRGRPTIDLSRLQSVTPLAWPGNYNSASNNGRFIPQIPLIFSSSCTSVSPQRAQLNTICIDNNYSTSAGGTMYVCQPDRGGATDQCDNAADMYRIGVGPNVQGTEFLDGTIDPTTKLFSPCLDGEILISATGAWECGPNGTGGGGSATNLTADTGGNTTGSLVTIAGGTNGIDTIRAGDVITLNLDLSELAASSITDAMVSDTLTASSFVGSGSTTGAVDLATAEAAGILTVAKGGTGVNALDSAVITWMQTPSSDNLRLALTGETGTGGGVVFATAPVIATPSLTGKIKYNAVSVSDDDCTGEQGYAWYDDTDAAFEFCNTNSGVPTVLGGGGGSSPFTVAAGPLTYLTDTTSDFALGGSNASAALYFDVSAGLLTFNTVGAQEVGVEIAANSTAGQQMTIKEDSDFGSSKFGFDLGGHGGGSNVDLVGNAIYRPDVNGQIDANAFLTPSTVTENLLKAVNSPTDELPLTYEATTGDFEWQVLTVPGGGTGLSAGTSGGIPYFNATNTMASSAALTNLALVMGGGAGAAPKVAAGLASDGVSKITLGVAGTSVGAVSLANATSGSVVIQPVTGALGTTIIQAPAPNTTDTMALLNATQTFDVGVKTFKSGTFSLAGSSSGSQLLNASPVGGVTAVLPAGGGSLTAGNVEVTFATGGSTARTITFPANANIVMVGETQTETLTNKTLPSFELGTAATDTTITRSAAGKMAVEGIDVVLLSGAQELSNKTLASFELGTGATDTTITRDSAGVMAVEGATVPTIAGRSLTKTSATIDADAELYTRAISFTELTPLASHDFLWHKMETAATLTSFSCIANGGSGLTTIDYSIQECTGSGGGSCAAVGATQTMTTVDTDPGADTSFTDASIAVDSWLKVFTGTVTWTTPGFVTCTLRYTVDD
jgi:hypothetical protein